MRLYGIRNFHHKSQLVIIVKFSLPGNWALWSVTLSFALRTAPQITYQQLIHISCGLVPIKGHEKRFSGKITPYISFVDKTYLARLRSRKVRMRTAMRSWPISLFFLTRLRGRCTTRRPGWPRSFLLDHHQDVGKLQFRILPKSMRTCGRAALRRGTASLDFF